MANPYDLMNAALSGIHYKSSSRDFPKEAYKLSISNSIGNPSRAYVEVTEITGSLKERFESVSINELDVFKEIKDGVVIKEETKAGVVDDFALPGFNDSVKKIDSLKPAPKPPREKTPYDCIDAALRGVTLKNFELEVVINCLESYKEDTDKTTPYLSATNLKTQKNMNLNLNEIGEFDVIAGRENKMPEISSTEDTVILEPPVKTDVKEQKK